MSSIRKAVFPVAGLGTRFLPATKANPKEMLPIVDKPLIQYAAEEAVAAGITELIFVTSSAKRSIEDHFDTNLELETMLQQREDTTRLRIVQDILPQGVSCIYIRQNRPLGLGHAVLCAKALIGDEPFAVLLADDLILGNKQTCMEQMIELYHRTESSVLAVEEIPRSDTEKYGIIAVDDESVNYQPINHIVEKPKPSQAPSNLAAVGRYILTPEIFETLRHVQPDKKGEIQLTDAIAALLKKQSVYAYRFEGRRFDCGDKIGYLRATVHLGLQHPEVGTEFAKFLKSL